MKSVAVFVVIGAAFVFVAQAAFTAEQLERIASHRKICQESSKVDEASLSSIRAGNYKDSAPVREYFACMAKRCEFVNEAGVLQKPIINKKLQLCLEDAALAAKLTEECAVPKPDAFETAFNVIKCFYDKNAKVKSML